MQILSTYLGTYCDCQVARNEGSLRAQPESRRTSGASPVITVTAGRTRTRPAAHSAVQISGRSATGRGEVLGGANGFQMEIAWCGTNPPLRGVTEQCRRRLRRPALTRVTINQLTLGVDAGGLLAGFVHVFRVATAVLAHAVRADFEHAVGERTQK